MAKIELKSGGKQVTGKSKKYGTSKGSSFIPNKPVPQIGMGISARGDDYAEAMIESGRASEQAKEVIDTTPRSRDELMRSNFNLPGGSPTVMTNANKVERVVPLLNSQANLLSTDTYSGDANPGGDTYGEVDTDQTFEELTGFGDKKKKKKEVDPFNAQMVLLEEMQKKNKQSARSAISTIKSDIDKRQEAQTRSNESGLAQVKQALLLGGSSRYAPISSQGIISSKEAQGIQALANLDREEQQAIREVKQAQDASDYKLLESKLGILETIRSEKATAENELLAETKETEAQNVKDDALATLVGQGITSPIEIFQNLRDQGIDVSLGEVTQSLKGLNEFKPKSTSGFTLENKAIGQLLGSGLTTTDISNMQADLNAGASLDDILSGFEGDEQSAVRKAFGIDESKMQNVIPGKGAKSATDEAFIRTRLFAKIAPILNKGALSDSDRAIIDARIAEFRDAGLGEQEIMDTIAGIPPELNTPYNSTFRDLIVSNSETTEKQTQNINRLSQQLSAGNYQQAMNTVETLALAESRKQDPDNYLGTGASQFALKQAKELRNAVDDAEDVIGPLEGTLQTIMGKLAKSKDPRAAKVSAKITKLTAPMRNQLSGTAVTASESSFLEPLIPSLSDTVENFRIKVNELESQTLDRYNSTRSIVSLPEVTSEMVIDPKKRLILYSNDIYLPTNGQLDI